MSTTTTDRIDNSPLDKREREALQWLQDLLTTDTTLTQAELAKRTGIDSSTMGKILQVLAGTGNYGKYRHKVTTGVVTKIEDYRHVYIQMVEVANEYVETRVSRAVKMLVNSAWENDQMVMLEAPSRAGKTQAAKAVQRENPGRVIYVSARNKTTPAMLLQILCSATGIAPTNSRAVMQQRLIDGISPRTLIIIDQFQDLQGDAVGELMTLHDNLPNSRQGTRPILLLGTKQGYRNVLHTWDRHGQHEQFRERIRQRMQLGAGSPKGMEEILTLADVTALVLLYADNLPKASIEWIYQTINSTGSVTRGIDPLQQALQIETSAADISVAALTAAAKKIGQHL